MKQGIGRLAFFLGLALCIALNTGAVMADWMPVTALLGVACLVLASLRLRNMGASGWWSLALLVPLANLALLYFLLFAPAEYKTTRQMDRVMRVGAIVSILAVVFCLAAALVALLTM